MSVEFEQVPGKFLTSMSIARGITKLVIERGFSAYRCRFEEKTEAERLEDPRPHLKRTMLESVRDIKPVTVEERAGVYLLSDQAENARYLFEFSSPLPVVGKAFHARLSRVTPETTQDELCGLRSENLEGQVDFNSDKAGSLVETYGEMDPFLSAFFDQTKN